MLETNIRIVRPGWNLHLWIRKAVVEGADLSADLLQRTCGRLRHRYGLAAVPARDARGTLWVATREPMMTDLIGRVFAAELARTSDLWTLVGG